MSVVTCSVPFSPFFRELGQREVIITQTLTTVEVKLDILRQNTTTIL